MMNLKYIILTGILAYSSLIIAQTKSERSKITANYNIEKLNKMADSYKTLEIKQLEEAKRLAKINKWPLSYGKGGSFHQLIRVEDNKPVYYKTFNKNAARSTRATFLHNGGSMGLDVEGQDMSAYVWDAWVSLPTHAEFEDELGNSRLSPGNTFDPDPEDIPGTEEDELGGANHATHVAGTIIARGQNASAKGSAPKASVVSYDWYNDHSETLAEAANGMLLSNHSYGAIAEFVPDWKFGAYTTECRFWDMLMYDAPYYQMVVAGGNDGNDNTSNGIPLDGNSSFDKFTDHAVSKNSLTVANGKDLAINSSGEVVGTIYRVSSSSEGPTDDYRVKPDITGNGENVFSSIFTSNNSYASYWGTSMASPNVTGSLLLLQQLYNQQKGMFMLSATLRGLAKHTADDAGMLGPDSIFGWGYMNTKKAAECILNDGSTHEVEELDLLDGDSFSIQVISDGTNPLIASISWTDRGSDAVNFGTANDPTPDIVNDLDIKLVKDGTTYEPWKLTGVDSNTKGNNSVDIFERVDIDGASGTYTLTVSHKGTLFNNHQAYSLVISGITGTNLSLDGKSINNFKIWPNPNKGVFSIYLEEKGLVNIQVSNILGKVVYSDTYQNTPSNIKSINLNNLQKGVYLLSINNKGQRLTNKLIIE